MSSNRSSSDPFTLEGGGVVQGSEDGCVRLGGGGTGGGAGAGGWGWDGHGTTEIAILLQPSGRGRGEDISAMQVYISFECEA